jgi:Flp pilus assembly protein TadD
LRTASGLAETRRAVDALERIVERNPHHLGARLLLGRMYNTDYWQQVAGHDVRALRRRAAAHLEAAAGLAPHRVDVRVRRAWVMLRQGNFDAAALDFRAALAERQLDPDILNQIGFGLAHLGELEQAETVMQQAFDLNPFAPSDYHADFAVIQALRERAEEAEEHFLVSGETGLQYDAVRIANFAALPELPHYAGDIEGRFARNFRAAWQAASDPQPDDVLAWIAATLPFREAAHAAFMATGLQQRLAQSWPAPSDNAASSAAPAAPATAGDLASPPPAG